MSVLNSRITQAVSFGPVLGLAALLGVAASPVAAAPLGNMMAVAPAAPSSTAFQLVAAKHAASSTESIEDRITNLHKTLQITPDEDAKWDAVAQAMRENAAAMQKLVAGLDTSASITAVQDLKNYEQVTQAHVDGLKNLIASFTVLYDSMPDQQKKIADQAFQSFGHKGQPQQRASR